MRRSTVFSASLALTLAATVCLNPVRAEEKPDGGRVVALIRQLGDDSFQKREAASAALEASGEPALIALREAAATSDDAEVRRRASRLVALISTRIKRQQLARFVGHWWHQQGGFGQGATINADGEADLPPILYLMPFNTNPVLKGCLEVKSEAVILDVEVPSGRAKWRVDLSADGKTMTLKPVEGKEKSEFVLRKKKPR